jgi:Mg/Co/Ni transporter MgtE
MALSHDQRFRQALARAMDRGEMDGLRDLVRALPPGKVRTMLRDVDSHEILTLLDVLPAVLRRRVLSELSDTEIRRVREAALDSYEVRRTSSASPGWVRRWVSLRHALPRLDQRRL